ncbi:MAG TPA: CrcB family protein [Pseudonocardiaceae bacterium]
MRGPVLAAVAAGGAAGSLGRYAVGLACGGGPLGTLLVNVSGCLLIGLLLALTGPAGLLRPLLGVGVLGGYTTFSGYALDVAGLWSDGRPVLAAAYLLGTLLAATAAAHGGALLGATVRR